MRSETNSSVVYKLIFVFVSFSSNVNVVLRFFCAFSLRFFGSFFANFPRRIWTFCNVKRFPTTNPTQIWFSFHCNFIAFASLLRFYLLAVVLQ